ncbi:MAG: L-sorbosone dehydrogenase [Chthoniobacter sp.]|nr:L-sorbosone dehydrogenase [Chthoniobacter sp.]
MQRIPISMKSPRLFLPYPPAIHLFLLLLSGCAGVAQKPSKPIITEVLDPKPIKVEVAQLPPPSDEKESASKQPKVDAPPDHPVLRAPKGFQVTLYAEDLQKPRWLALTPDGGVLVTETRRNRIQLLRDTNGDGAADERSTFADESNGLNIPFGMSFSDNHFFLGNTDAVLRFPFQKGQTKLEGKGEKITDLPGGGYNQHWTRNVRVSPDGRHLFVTVGSKSNAEVEDAPRASVLRMNLDGSDRKTFADGLRNPVGLDFHPQTGDVHVTVNERDKIGDDLVPDYLTRIREGEFYGWPWAYFTPQHLDPRHLNGGQSTNPQAVAKTKMPDVLVEAHSAMLGLAFSKGDKFPAKYRNGAFAALRGSWNRSEGTGYKIIFIPFGGDHRPLGHYEDFVTGFLTDPKRPSTWGRPVGVIALPDGSLLFTEEENQRIYRVSYGGE